MPKPAYNDMVVGPDGPIMMRFKRKVALSDSEIAAAKAKTTPKAKASTTVSASGALAAAGGRVHAAGGNASGGVSLTKAVDSDYPNGKLIIMWGSQTGTAEGFGNTLMREARQRGYDAKSYAHHMPSSTPRRWPARLWPAARSTPCSEPSPFSCHDLPTCSML